MTEDHRLIKSAKSARDGSVTEAIPEDVMQTARDAFSSWQTNTGPGGVIATIAPAILAEREACAKIAETIKSGFWKDISDAIRRR